MPRPEALDELAKDRDFTADLKNLLASANVSSKRWVHEQYDTMVQTNTVLGPGGEAGVMRIKGTGTVNHERGLAMALDGNGRWAYLDPKLGAMHAVAEAARKVAHDGRAACGGDKLLELRQSREAGDHGAAFNGDRRDRRSLHCAGNADYRRQCFAL